MLFSSSWVSLNFIAALDWWYHARGRILLWHSRLSAWVERRITPNIASVLSLHLLNVSDPSPAELLPEELIILQRSWKRWQRRHSCCSATRLERPGWHPLFWSRRCTELCHPCLGILWEHTMPICALIMDFSDSSLSPIDKVLEFMVHRGWLA